MRGSRHLIGIGAVSAALALGGCGADDETTTAQDAPETSSSLPQGSEDVSLDPAEFTTNIDNPYLPLQPGNHWVYREQEEGESLKVDVTVTDRTKVVDGIEARVIRDVVTEKGELIEDTDDWFAQDAEGNVWYLGETTAEYANGKVVTRAGSWESGVDGAEAGIVMPADPQPGMSYREEYYKGEAEDEAKITGVDAKVTVPFGSYDQVVTTTNTTPLEPNVLEHKFYAPGVGVVREDLVSGGHGRTELIRFSERG